MEVKVKETLHKVEEKMEKNRLKKNKIQRSV